ncbi:MAG: hypothetical protein IPN68_06195 [Bacteroidetes bacterium]|nr:hypothetical protein [Bacteroidota bacterium]
MSRDLNIVTLNVPYPPDYGGMIDSFYRIKWLNEAGVNIHLHCFQYGRPDSKELELLCKSVHYYTRKRNFYRLFSSLPFIISSRDSIHLLENLKLNNYPILFDGLHTTYYINHPDLDDRKKFIRTHNIEHLYYNTLAGNERNLFKKLFYKRESLKLRIYEEKIMDNVNVLTISLRDNEYFKKTTKNTFIIPPLHPYAEVISSPGKGSYVLSMEISQSGKFINCRRTNKKVFSKNKSTTVLLLVKNPPASLHRYASRSLNVKIIADPDSARMDDLVRNAHINILPSFTANGFKLKYLIALYAGRFCILNNIAANSFSKNAEFHIADSYSEMVNQIKNLMNEEFTIEMISRRMQILEKDLSNQVNAKKIIDLIFK